MAIKTTVHETKQKGDRKHFTLERHTNQKLGFIFVLWGILAEQLIYSMKSTSYF